MPYKNIGWLRDEADYENLKTEYKAAVERGDAEFQWRGYDFVTNYVKYVIEYVEMQSEKPKA